MFPTASELGGIWNLAPWYYGFLALVLFTLAVGEVAHWLNRRGRAGKWSRRAQRLARLLCNPREWTDR